MLACIVFWMQNHEQFLPGMNHILCDRLFCANGSEAMLVERAVAPP